MNVLQRKLKNLLTKVNIKVIHKRKSFLKEAKESTSDIVLTSTIQSRTPSKRKSSKLYKIMERWIHQIHSNAKNIPENKSEYPYNISKVKSSRVKNHVDFQKQIAALKANSEYGPDFKIYDDNTVTPRKCASYVNLEEGNTPAPPLPPRKPRTFIGDAPLIERNSIPQNKKMIIYDYNLNTDEDTWC